MFSPGEIDGILKQVRTLFQDNDSTFLFIHEKGLSFQFIGLWFDDTDEVDIQKYLFKDQYDDLISKVVDTYDSGKRQMENFASYKISRQMVPFFDLVFLMKYQKKIHIGSANTSIILDTINLEYPSDQSQLYAHKLYMALIDHISPMRQQEITQFYGTEIDIFGDVLIRDEDTETDYDSADRVTSPAPSSIVSSPCSDPQQEALNLLVDELK